jgi:hypothetical protein
MRRYTRDGPSPASPGATGATGPTQTSVSANVDSFGSTNTTQAVTTTFANLNDGTTTTQFTTGAFAGNVKVTVDFGEIDTTNPATMTVKVVSTGTANCGGIFAATMPKQFNGPTSIAFLCTKTSTSAETLTVQVQASANGTITIVKSPVSGAFAVKGVMLQTP